MSDMLEIVRVGGPVAAVSAMFLVYMDKEHKRTFETINNHLNHLNETMNKNNVVLERLSGLISQLVESKRTKRK